MFKMDPIRYKCPNKKRQAKQTPEFCHSILGGGGGGGGGSLPRLIESTFHSARFSLPSKLMTILNNDGHMCS